MAGRGNSNPRLEDAEEEGMTRRHEDAEDEVDEEEDDAVAPRVNRTAKPIKTGKRLKKDTQLGFRFAKAEEFELPSLTLLAEPKRLNRGADLSDEALEQNARMLEGVLEDFGVKGQIINVRPGPVVTLYELEPAPGIKSSRVISLADDIARSMSAVCGPRRRRSGTQRHRHRTAQHASARPSICANCSPPRPSRKPARTWRWRSARTSAANRSSPISPACRIC